MTNKELALIKLIAQVLEKAQDINYQDSMFVKDSNYSSELFYARQSGRFQGLLHRVASELKEGKDIEDIRL